MALSRGPWPWPFAVALALALAFGSCLWQLHLALAFAGYCLGAWPQFGFGRQRFELEDLLLVGVAVGGSFAVVLGWFVWVHWRIL